MASTTMVADSPRGSVSERTASIRAVAEPARNASSNRPRNQPVGSRSRKASVTSSKRSVSEYTPFHIMLNSISTATACVKQTMRNPVRSTKFGSPDAGVLPILVRASFSRPSLNLRMKVLDFVQPCGPDAGCDPVVRPATPRAPVSHRCPPDALPRQGGSSVSWRLHCDPLRSTEP